MLALTISSSHASDFSASPNFFNTLDQNINAMGKPRLGQNIYNGNIFSSTVYKDYAEAVYDGLKLSTYFKYSAECKTYTYAVLD